jgi:glutaminase
MMYAVAVEDRGLSLVHRHVGFEPSGLAFNEVRSCDLTYAVGTAFISPWLLSFRLA